MSGGFEAMGLSPELQRAIDEMGYYLPTEVQDETIPLILGGGDVMVAAPTGSGKTGAFALPIIELVHQKKCETYEDLSQLFVLSEGACVLPGRGFETVGEKWCGARLRSSRRREFAIRVSGDGIVRIGWSLQGASLDLGSDSRGAGYGGTAKKVVNGAFEAFGKRFGNGDVVSSVLNEDGTIDFFLNGELQGSVEFDTRGETAYPTVSARRGAWTWLGLDDVVENDDKAKIPSRKCSAIILEPARDLAEQTHDCFVKYSQYVKDLTCRLLIGGCDRREEERACARGDCDVLTGTPRKILDCVKRGILDVSSSRFLVLDEADRFGDEQHEDKRAALEIFDRMPKGVSRTNRLQVAFFSATLHSQSVRILADRLCDQPTWVDLKGDRHVPEGIHHLVVSVDPRRDRSWPNTKTDGVHRGGKLDGPLLERVDSETIKRTKPHVLVQVLDRLQVDQVMVFCRTNLDCDLLELFLKNKNKEGLGGGVSAYSCCVLAGARDMKERRASLKAFKAGEVRIMICTDVAARGIDVKGLPFVVNMTLPDSEETYVHRVGRVGRSDKIGLAVSIVATCPEKVWYCQKNKKPPQHDTRLFKDGGNCVWYDEPKLLEAIRRRVEKVWTVTPDTIALPDDLRALQFGDNEQTPSRVKSKQDDIDTLKRLGTQSQRGFFKLQRIMLAERELVT